MHETFMRRAIAIAGQSLDMPGGLPYGAVVVKDGRIIGEGVNRAAALNDPTSHGEVEAVRDACRKLGTTQLDGALVYTSCEPCAMCVATMLLAGISGVYYASSLQDSAVFYAGLMRTDAKWRARLAADELRRQTGLPIDQRTMPAHRILVDEGQALLDAFAARQAGSR